MKTAIVYHQVKPGIDCADGIAAAWVVKQKHPMATLIGACYGSDAPDLSDFDRAYIVDFSFPIDVLRRWEEVDQIEITVIDHHKTAMADLSQFANAFFDMNESGATLTWKILFPDQPVPAWLQYVRDRDLWNFELPASEEIHEAVSFMGRTMRQMDWLCSLSAEELHQALAPIGIRLLEPKRKRIAEIASTAKESIVAGYKVLVVEINERESRLTSDVCSAIYKANPDHPFVMAYSWNSKDSLFGLSFRSDKNSSNFDVSEVARQFGGGGHRNASGASASDIQEVLG